MEMSLYDQLAAKIEKERFPEGKPDAPPPADGIEEAVLAMEQVVREKFTAKIRKAQWTFYERNGECIPPPCGECGPKPSPLHSRWWRNVCEWQGKQKKRCRDMEDDPLESFEEAIGVHDDNVRVALEVAWSAKNPKLPGMWEQDESVFSVAFNE